MDVIPTNGDMLVRLLAWRTCEVREGPAQGIIILENKSIAMLRAKGKKQKFLLCYAQRIKLENHKSISSGGCKLARCKTLNQRAVDALRAPFSSGHSQKL
jgi:hypothetical protein